MDKHNPKWHLKTTSRTTARQGIKAVVTLMSDGKELHKDEVKLWQHGSRESFAKECVEALNGNLPPTRAEEFRKQIDGWLIEEPNATMKTAIVQARSVRKFEDFDCPEDVLAYAVLAQSIEDLLHPFFDKRNKYQELAVRHNAYAWFLADEDKYLFCYACICTRLDINPVNLRRKLLAKYETLEHT